MSVVLATKVYGSEHLVALIRHYREHPGPQKEAAAALSLPQQLVSKSTRFLVDAGVVTEEPAPGAGRARIYGINTARAEALFRELHRYSLGEPSTSS